MQIPLPFVAYIPGTLAQAINYPGEARYLAIMPGLNNEIWYDDGVYTGLARITLPDFLAQANIAIYAALFQRRPDVPVHWFLLDQQRQALFIGTNDMVTLYLQHNTYAVPSYLYREGA